MFLFLLSSSSSPPTVVSEVELICSSWTSPGDWLVLNCVWELKRNELDLFAGHEAKHETKREAEQKAKHAANETPKLMRA